MSKLHNDDRFKHVNYQVTNLENIVVSKYIHYFHALCDTRYINLKGFHWNLRYPPHLQITNLFHLVRSFSVRTFAVTSLASELGILDDFLKQCH